MCRHNAVIIGVAGFSINRDMALARAKLTDFPWELIVWNLANALNMSEYPPTPSLDKYKACPQNVAFDRCLWTLILSMNPNNLMEFSLSRASGSLVPMTPSSPSWNERCSTSAKQNQVSM